MESKKTKLIEQNQAIAKLVSTRERLSKKLTDNKVEMQKLEHKLARYQTEKGESARYVEQLEKKYPWISSEKQ